MKKFIVLLLFIFVTGCVNVNVTINKENDEKEEYSNDNLEDNAVNKPVKEESLPDSNISNEKDTNLKVEESSNDNNVSNQESVLEDDSNFKSETELINHFVNLKEDIKGKLNKDTWNNVKTSVLNSLNSIYGFCFKNEEIGGYTFKELSTDAKEKILNIVYEIDETIEEFSPNYKENIKENYDKLKDKTKDSITNIKDKVVEWWNNRGN